MNKVDELWWIDPNFKKREPKPKPTRDRVSWDSLYMGTAININKGVGPAHYVADPMQPVFRLNREMRRRIFGTRGH